METLPSFHARADLTQDGFTSAVGKVVLALGFREGIERGPDSGPERVLGSGRR